MISVQPATPGYAWQVEVYLNNFLQLGYNGNFIEVLVAYKDRIPEEWLKLQQAFPYVRFFFYRDEMIVNNYPPAIQAHVLAKHFKAFPELKNDAIFFHDCDFVFTKYFDFSKFQHDDNWYFSDTVSYVGADYIESKSSLKDENGVGLLDNMCRVVGICSCTVRGKKAHSGGAQKLMKNLTSEYWAEVEQDAINLYNWLLQNKDKYREEGSTDIQIWTASMWSELWNAWKYKHNVVIPKEFNFAWATCPVERWDTYSFFHNAGVMNDKQGMFYKGKYMDKLPYFDSEEVDPSKCSSKYYELIKQTGEKSVLIS